MSDEMYIDGIDVEDLAEFEEEGYSEEDAITLGKGLLLRAIPCLPTIYDSLDEAELLLIKYAILEMAKYLRIEYSNFERATSPFQSETIGSYSYSRLMRSVQAGEETGVPQFDRAVALIGPKCYAEDGSDDVAFATSEQVFQEGFHNRRTTNFDDGYQCNTWFGRFR